MLHNKWLFNQQLVSYGFEAPKSFLITTKKDLEKIPFPNSYVLKPCYSRAAYRVMKVDSLKSLANMQFDPSDPWIAQEWIEGKKFCTYGIAINGELKAHSVYPVQYAIKESSCLNFEAIKDPRILHWIQEFVKKEKFTGNIAFDFIENSKGKLFAIECNPRGTSGIHLFKKEDRLHTAFFNQNNTLIQPKIGSTKQIAFGMLMYGWKTKHLGTSFFSFCKKLLKTPDCVFSWKDVKPFLFQPLLFCIYIYRSLKINAPIPIMFTYDTDWNGEALSFREQEVRKKFNKEYINILHSKRSFREKKRS